MDETLQIYWVDWRGVTWNLTTGEQGVLLAEGAADFGLPPIHHVMDVSGVVTTTVTDPARPSLAVEVGVGLSGQEYYELADEWWSVANETGKVGLLVVHSPGRPPRWGKFLLREAPDVTWRNDPGLRQERPVEPWLLQGVSPYWSEATQTLTYSREGLEMYKPFYGDTGEWPLYLTPKQLGGSKTFTNTGQGRMWAKWELKGPLTNPSIAYGLAIIRYNGTIPRGGLVTVETDPSHVYARDVWGENVLNKFTIPGGRFPSIPRGESVTVRIDSEEAGTDAHIKVSASEQHLRPF